MNIAPAHIEALEALGYTAEEARFLYIVATHSGYFTARQFLAFTGAHWGKRTTLFWNKLKNARHARTECFPQSGVVCHVFSRRLYRRIGKENVRNRRSHEIDFIKRRIVMLDFVLLHPEHKYLETEQDKVRFFCGTLNIERNYLPSRLYIGSKTPRTSVRYFVDKFPMFLGLILARCDLYLRPRGRRDLHRLRSSSRKLSAAVSTAFGISVDLCFAHRFALQESRRNLSVAGEDATRIRHHGRLASLLQCA